MQASSLKPGDKIGVMAPSSRADWKLIDQGTKRLWQKGYEIYIHPQSYTEFNQSAGREEDKVNALHDLFADPNIKAIIAAKGGNRAGHILPFLNYDLIRDNPKILLGFSDATALLNAIHSQTGLITFHGPTLEWLANDNITDDHLDQCLSLLSGTDTEIPMKNSTPVQKGTASGPLIGGNLSVFTSLIGTPYMPDTAGAVLFLEDCDDEISRFDRMFAQIANAGILKQISGLILGEFINIQDTGEIPYGFSLEDICQKIAKEFDIPVIINAPFGHNKHLYTFPVGGKAELAVSKNNSALNCHNAP